MSKSSIISNAIQILNENRGEMELKEYVLVSAENDPTFFYFLFGSEADNITDFGGNMTEEQKEAYSDFLNEL